MTVTENSPQLEKLNFNPSLNEQLLLSKVHENNLLFVYSKEESLIRILSLLILFYLNSQSTTDTPSKILIIVRRSWQTKIQALLKSYMKRKTTTLNGFILPNARRQDYNRYSVILVTPKIAKNDLKEKFFSVDNFSLVVFLNAEMGSSSQSSRYLANKMQKARVIGFTEYSDLDRLEKVCKNLHFAEIHQLDHDEVQGKQERNNIQYYSIPLPQEYFFILELLDEFRKHELTGLEKLGYKVKADSTSAEISAIHESIKTEGVDTRQLVLTGNLLRIMNLQKVIISQGFPAAVNYLESLISRLNGEEKFDGKQAIIKFLSDIKIIKLLEFLKSKSDLVHPKCQMIEKMISEYRTGVSIVTHNYDNADYLKQHLQERGKTNIVQIKKPITSLSKVKLEQKLLHFTEGKTEICITNSVNEFIAKYAKVIIAYDVNSEIIETLNNLNSSIPKIFLISKQTNEESRFFYLKRVGTRSHIPNLNLSVVNQALTKNKEKIHAIQESSSDDSLGPSHERDRPLIPKNTLFFSSILYEYGIPYSFSDKEYEINLNKDIQYPGFIVNVEVLILVLIPETVDYFKTDNLGKLFNKLKENFSDVYLVISSQILENMSFQFRYTLLENVNRSNLFLFILKKEDDLNNFVQKIV